MRRTGVHLKVNIPQLPRAFRVDLLEDGMWATIALLLIQ